MAWREDLTRYLQIKRSLLSKVQQLFFFMVSLVTLGLTSELSAQNPEIRFKHLSFKNGLAQSPISCITKDSKGFIWLGNWKGLTRYDGYEFRTFHHDNNNHKSISNNRVNSISKDRNGKLWIGTSNGVNLYDAGTETFKRVDIRNLKGGRNFISDVFQDSYGQVWAATFAGIKQVDTIKNALHDLSFLKEQQDSNLFAGITFRLFEDQQRTIWVGTKKGVKRFDPLKRKLLPLPLLIQHSEELMQAKVLVMRQQKNGVIWFGTETSGLYAYDPAKNTLRHIKQESSASQGLLSNWIRDIYIPDEEHIWIGTRNGLSIYNTRLQTFSNYHHHPLDPDGLNDSTIWSMMQDQASGIWIGTFSGGLNVYYPSNANFSNIGERAGMQIGLSHPVVNALQEDNKGGLWVGTYGGGINYLERSAKKYQYYPIKQGTQSRNRVKSLALDAAGNLWIGTLDGLCRMDKTTRQIKFYEFAITQGKFSENLINAIVPDHGGVWAATNGGGLRYLRPDGSYDTFTHLVTNLSSLSDNFVTALLKDQEGNLWVGTQNGLNYYDQDKKEFRRFIKNERPYSLNNNSITTLLKDSKGRLWVGTEGGGLSYYDVENERFYALNQGKVLTDEVIHKILEDQSGAIWVSTDNGLYQLRFKTFKVPFKEAAVKVTHYDATDGLASNQFLTNSGLSLKSGELLFGGINGLTSFFPDRIIKNKVKPKVVLTEFLIRNKAVAIDSASSPLKQSISYTKSVVLNYDQGYITIKFAALNFINAGKNAYSYKLEGLRGEDWHYAGNQRTINYTNLEPGDYVFKVIAANNDGVWNKMPTNLSITVLPPWWQTWWAYLLYFLIAGMIARTIYVFLINRAKLKKELYLEHLYNERQEELHQMKIDFFTNISHEIRTPLTLILGPLEKMVQSPGASESGFFKPLLQVQQNAYRLMRLVTELMDFRQADTGNLKLSFSLCNLVQFTKEIYLSFQNLAEENQIEYVFESPQEQVMVYFDKDHFEKVLFNLLSNAFKFSHTGGKISVIIHSGQDWADLQISDTGKGIEEKHLGQLFNRFFQVKEDQAAGQGYGIGLALSKSIVDLHLGKIEVKSQLQTAAGSGTTFTVSLRKGSAHLEQSKLVPEFMNSNNPVHYYLQSQEDRILTPYSPALPKSKYTLLIIEDNDELRAFIRQSFSELYSILEAENGRAGLALVLDQMPDLVISDVMMPEMDGLELCRRMKTDLRINHIPVILLTARAAYIHQVNGLEKGADAYLTKPFSIQVLELNVKNILATKEAQKKRFSAELVLSPASFLSDAASADEKFLRKLMDLVEAHLDDPDFDVTAISQEIGMSKTVLYKKVQALTNLTIADLIKSVRLKSAAALLEQNKTGIAEIAFAVGFSDRKYFSKEFKKLYKVSPSEYVALHAVLPKD